LTSGASVAENQGGAGSGTTGGSPGVAADASCASNAAKGGGGSITTGGAAGNIGCIMITDTTSSGHSSALNVQTSGGTDLLRVTDTGQTVIKPSTDSLGAVQVQNAAGTTVFDTDTADKRVGINLAAPTASLDILGGSASETVFQIAQSAGQSGDLMHINNTNGTALVKVDSSGNEERLTSIDSPYGGIGVMSNLLAYSEQFDEASNASVTFWTSTLNTVTPNTVAAPNGTTTADTLVSTGNQNISQKFPQPNSGLADPGAGNYTFSVWLKQASGASQTGLCIFSASGTPPSCSATAVTPSTSDWQRFSVTTNVTLSGGVITAEILPGNGSTASVYAWGAQLVKDTVPEDYAHTEFNGTTSWNTNNTPSSGISTNEIYATNGLFRGNLDIQSSNGTGGNFFEVADDTNNRYFDVTSSNGGSVEIGVRLKVYTGITTDPKANIGTAEAATDPTAVDGAIYYNETIGAGEFRCSVNGVWQSCQGMKDVVDRRWGYTSLNSTTAAMWTSTTGNMQALTTSPSASLATDAQAESNYLKSTSTNSATNEGGWNGPFTDTEARWQPKLETRIHTDANLTATGGKMWVGLTSASLVSTTVPTSAAVNATIILGIGYQTGTNGGKFLCVSGDGTNISGTDTGITATASHIYDVIIDYSAAGTLECSIADDGAVGSFAQGTYETVAKQSNTPSANSTAIGIEAGEQLTSGTTARALSASYFYLESN
jgi:hypothetical protein